MGRALYNEEYEHDENDENEPQVPEDNEKNQIREFNPKIKNEKEKYIKEIEEKSTGADG